MLALYVLTGPQSNRIGLFVFSVATASEDLGTLPQTITKRLANVTETFGWPFDKGSRVIWIPSWFKWNPPENLNVMKGSLKDLNEIPPCGLIDAFARNIETVPQTLHETFLEGLRQRLPNGIRTQDQYQYQDLNQEQKPARSARAEKRKAVSGTESESAPTEYHVAVANETLRLTSHNRPLEELVDAFQSTLHHKGNSCSRSEALAALNAALADRRVS
ncbi:MAG TPA: hypothetical protein VGF24_29395 [Vicinamibacterales bacterium]